MTPASRAIAPSLLATAVEELRRHPPFDRMELEHVRWMVARLRLAYHPPGTVILAPAQGAPQALHIVKQGAVTGETPGHTGAARWQLTPGECFPLGALLGRRPVTSVYRAQGDTFCYQLEGGDFDQLMRSSETFRDYCVRGVASLLADSRRGVQGDTMREVSRDPLDQPLATLIRRPAVTCSPACTLRGALESMRQERVGSILVVDDAGAPLGIFTLRDLRDRVVPEGSSLDRPIASVMTAPTMSLPDTALAFEAALVMARRGIHHMVVTREAKATAVLSEADLFVLQRVGVTRVSEAIRWAAERGPLESAAADIRRLAENLLAQGVAAQQLTRIVSALNDLLTVRLVELELHSAGVEVGELCWLAFGSEGRHEQTLATDQDNGIIFPDSAGGGDPERARARLLPAAQRINEGLAACGFPLCKGGIMAGNPSYCLSRTEWKHRFSDWMRDANPQALLNASIFFDFRPLAGATALAEELRGWLAGAARSQSLFLRLMAENALRNPPPLGLLRDFAVAEHDGRPHTLDLKLSGATPFVDAARILSLATGDTHTNTAERLRAAGAKWHLAEAEIEAWVEAFHFVQLLRLRVQQQRAKSGATPDNLLDPDVLNDLDRRILKEAFRQARKLQEQLKLDYQL